MLMKGFFTTEMGCLQIWGCLAFLLAELGRRQHPSAAALPAENQWYFGPQGRAFTGVNWWLTVTLLESVCVRPVAACSGPAPCMFPKV